MTRTSRFRLSGNTVTLTYDDWSAEVRMYMDGDLRDKTLASGGFFDNLTWSTFVRGSVRREDGTRAEAEGQKRFIPFLGPQLRLLVDGVAIPKI